MHRQAGAAEEQGIHLLPTQERTGMVSGGMAQGRIGISSAPRQDQTAAHGMSDGEDEEGLKAWGSCRLLAPAICREGLFLV